MSDHPNMQQKPQITPLSLKPDLLRSLSQENSGNAPPSPERYPTFDYQQFLAFRQPGGTRLVVLTHRFHLLPKKSTWKHARRSEPQSS
jgi:hypothetical protein